jgi:hypothetical protein
MSLEFIESELPHVCLGHGLNLKPSPFQDLEESTKDENKCMFSQPLLTSELISEEQANHGTQRPCGANALCCKFYLITTAKGCLRLRVQLYGCLIENKQTTTTKK